LTSHSLTVKKLDQDNSEDIIWEKQPITKNRLESGTQQRRQQLIEARGENGKTEE